MAIPKTRSKPAGTEPALPLSGALDFTRDRLAQAEAVIRQAAQQLKDLERGAALKTLEAYLRPKGDKPPARLTGKGAA